MLIYLFMPTPWQPVAGIISSVFWKGKPRLEGLNDWQKPHSLSLPSFTPIQSEVLISNKKFKTSKVGKWHFFSFKKNKSTFHILLSYKASHWELLTVCHFLVIIVKFSPVSFTDAIEQLISQRPGRVFHEATMVVN